MLSFSYAGGEAVGWGSFMPALVLNGETLWRASKGVKGWLREYMNRKIFGFFVSFEKQSQTLAQKCK